MDLSAPIADVIPGPRGAIIAALVRLRVPVTGRELAAQAGVPPATAARVVNDLQAAGLIERGPAGHVMGVVLNRRHLAVPALEELAGMRAGLVGRLRSTITQWKVPAVAGWLFGSAARGDGSRHSDIDIVVVARRERSVDWEQQIGELGDLAVASTGNTAQVIDYSRKEFRELVDSDNPLIRALRSDGIELVESSTVLLRAR
jgi:Polymerase beta, Nucleotidyltransferase/MarR family